MNAIARQIVFGNGVVMPLSSTGDDAALVDAEREIHRLWALAAQDIENDVPDWILDRVRELDDFIERTHAISIVGAAVKLRRLLSADKGLEVCSSKSHVPLARDVLATIEREISRRAL